MSEQEKTVLGQLAKAVGNLSEKHQAYLLGYAEGAIAYAETMKESAKESEYVQEDNGLPPRDRRQDHRLGY